MDNIQAQKMEVSVTAIPLAGGKEQVVFMEMPAGGYVPNVGDGLTFNGTLYEVTERQFQVNAQEDALHCKYGWSIKAEQK